MTYIYTIRSLVDDEVLYCGSTEAPSRRKSQHFTKLSKGNHESKTLQKLYDLVDGNVYFHVEAEYRKDIMPTRIIEYLWTSYLRPLANKTFNMSTTKRFDTMKLMDKDLAKEIIEKIV